MITILGLQRMDSDVCKLAFRMSADIGLWSDTRPFFFFFVKNVREVCSFVFVISYNFTYAIRLTFQCHNT
jgi:hypothetical protein